MTKTGLPDKTWWARLRGLAAGTYKFGQGQTPRKGTKWAEYAARIKSCPLTGSGSSNAHKTDLFGKLIQCSCSFHNKVLFGLWITFESSP